MSSEWVTGVAALLGTVVGGGITIVGQFLEGRRLSKEANLNPLSATLAAVMDGSTAIMLSAGNDEIRQLMPALFRLVLQGNEPLSEVAVEWLRALGGFQRSRDIETYRGLVTTFEGKLLAIAIARYVRHEKVKQIPAKVAEERISAM